MTFYVSHGSATKFLRGGKNYILYIILYLICI